LILLGLPLVLRNLSTKKRVNTTLGAAGVLGALDLNAIRDQVFEHLNNAPVSLALGKDGLTYETVEIGSITERVNLIKDIIVESVSDPEIQRRAKSLSRGTDSQEVQAVFRFVKQNVRFESEEPLELFKDANTTLNIHGYGDCDDICILAAALLINQKFSVILTVVGTGDDSDFSHIYLKVGLPKRGPKKWVSFDASVDRPLGWDISQEKTVTMQKDYRL